MATRRTSWSSRTALAAAAATVLVLLAGCSGGSDDSDSSDSASGGGAAAAPAADDGGGGAESAADVGGPAPEQQRVVSTGSVQLRSEDVGKAVFDVQGVADSYGGQVAEDDTETDRAGRALRSRMVLRIPTADFDAAMDDLGALGTLVASKRQTEDVTTQVLDVDVRVAAQQRSIDRIQVLFDEATSIKDVMSIESELSRRQADLASLEAQQRYLADQTAQSTITVSVERTRAAAAEPSDTDDAGFLAGLSSGWHALRSFLLGAATVAGALLPWLLLLAVLAVPARPLVRRWRRRTTAAA